MSADEFEGAANSQSETDVPRRIDLLHKRENCLRLISSGELSAEGLKPTADVDLRVRLTAIVARAGGIGGLFRPPDNPQLSITALNHKPPNRALRLFSTDFASIHCFNHFGLRLLSLTIHGFAPG
jgi:hypothetical protein